MEREPKQEAHNYYIPTGVRPRPVENPKDQTQELESKEEFQKKLGQLTDSTLRVEKIEGNYGGGNAEFRTHTTGLHAISQYSKNFDCDYVGSRISYGSKAQTYFGDAPEDECVKLSITLEDDEYDTWLDFYATNPSQREINRLIGESPQIEQVIYTASDTDSLKNLIDADASSDTIYLVEGIQSDFIADISSEHGAPLLTSLETSMEITEQNNDEWAVRFDVDEEENTYMRAYGLNENSSNKRIIGEPEVTFEEAREILQPRNDIHFSEKDHKENARSVMESVREIRKFF